MTPRRNGPIPAAYLPVSEALVLRALEIAGKRALGRARHRHPHLDPWQYHTVATSEKAPAQLAAGVFTGTVEVVAASIGVDPADMRDQLTGYVTRLIETHEPHSRARLRAWILQDGDDA